MMAATLSAMLAYLDAGSASAIVTLVLGGIAGVGVALKHRWHRLLVALRLRKPIEQEQQAEPNR
jgi:hypothetical protein